MVVKKPSIFIYTNNANGDLLKEICAGIEEQGVFFEVFEQIDADIDSLAFNAAKDSMMGAGLGINNTCVALQMKGLAKGKNVEFYSMPTKEECRKIGANSARAIKKLPFI